MMAYSRSEVRSPQTLAPCAHVSRTCHVRSPPPTPEWTMREMSYSAASPFLTWSHVPRALIRMMAALGVSAGSRMHETR